MTKNLLPEKLTHNKTWKESEETILDIVKEVFILLKDIWVNPAFNSDLAESLNEGTYQSTIIFSQEMERDLDVYFLTKQDSVKDDMRTLIQKEAGYEGSVNIMYISEEGIIGCDFGHETDITEVDFR
ncbi:2911_t:CDS:2, partial [Gigaspora rosea]